MPKPKKKKKKPASNRKPIKKTALLRQRLRKGKAKRKAGVLRVKKMRAQKTKTKRKKKNKETNPDIIFDSTVGKTDALFVDEPAITPPAQTPATAPSNPEPAEPEELEKGTDDLEKLEEKIETEPEEENPAEVEKEESLPDDLSESTPPETKAKEDQPPETNKATFAFNLPDPPKKSFHKKFFNLNNHFFSIFIGLIFAGVFCAGVYVFADPTASPYTPPAPLEPGCAPGSTNCTVRAPIPYTGATADLNLGAHYLEADNGFLSTGTTTGFTIPSGIGSGTRLMWIPSLGAFRAGIVDSSNPTAWNEANIGWASFATGNDNEVQGTWGFSTGYNNFIAPSFSSSAVGSGNSIGPGVNVAIAFGGGNQINPNNYNDGTGSFSIAIGQSNTLSDVKGSQSDIAIGQNLTVDRSSIAVGGYGTATGSLSSSFGIYNNATGNESVAIGFGATAANQGSIVIGDDQSVSGNLNDTNAIGGLTLGGYNPNVSGGTGENWLTIMPAATANNPTVTIGQSTGAKLLMNGELGILEQGGTAGKYTYFQGGAQSADITYTLPTASANGALTNSSGTLSWTTLNQAAVAGLTTADSPSFAGLTATGASGLTLGASATTMVPGYIKLFSAGTLASNNFYTTFTAGTQTATAAYTLPTSSVSGLLRNTSGTLSWDTNTYLTTAGNAASATKSTNLIGGNSTTLLGSIPYQSDVDTTTLLAPNTTTTKKFLTMAGNGTNGAVPSWGTLATTDIPDISGTYSVIAGNSSIATVGIITSGTWHGGVIGAAYGGTGIANNAANTITFSGNYGLTLTLSNTTSLTLPTSGTLMTTTGNTSGTANVAGGTAGAIPYQTAANTTGVLAATTTANQVLLSGASASPAWSTETFPTSTAQGDLLYSSAANVVSSLAKSGTANQYLKNSGTSNNPAWATISTSDISGEAFTYTGASLYNIYSALARTEGTGTYNFIEGSGAGSSSMTGSY
ncbi:MAG: hypothetical protein ABSA74_01070, partial [Candidatus Staskawiczbacteria bacterium]